MCGCGRVLPFGLRRFNTACVARAPAARTAGAMSGTDKVDVQRRQGVWTLPPHQLAVNGSPSLGTGFRSFWPAPEQLPGTFALTGFDDCGLLGQLPGKTKSARRCTVCAGGCHNSVAGCEQRVLDAVNDLFLCDCVCSAPFDSLSRVGTNQ